jgi:hypothetical protein
MSTSAGGCSATALHSPLGLALDASSNLFVVDQSNHRVVVFPANYTTTATIVYGQTSFDSNTVNSGGESAWSLNSPHSVAVVGSAVYIADSGNNRVLSFGGSGPAPAGTGTTTTTTPAPTTTTTTGAQTTTTTTTGTTATTTTTPTTTTATTTPAPVASPSATAVYGQIDFAHRAAGTSATALNLPADLNADTSGNVYVADFSNSRVLFFPSFSMNATRVYGQLGSFTSSTANNGGVSADSLYRPVDVAFGANDVYITDTWNHRVLYQLACFASPQFTRSLPALSARCLPLSFSLPLCCSLSLSLDASVSLSALSDTIPARAPRRRACTVSSARLRRIRSTRAEP